MSKTRKKYTNEFKANVALEACKADKTREELVAIYDVTSGQISTWKKQLLEGAPLLFDVGRPKEVVDSADLTAPLYEEIGRLKVELDGLKKKIG